MKYKDTNFRSIVGKTFVIAAEDFKSVIESLPGNEKADVLLTYAYIDHEAGVTLEVLAAGNKTEDGYTFYDPDKSSMAKIRMHSIEDYELTEIELNDERFTEKIAIAKMYDDNPEVAQSREFEFLDHLRDIYCVDDVLVYLFKDELELEGCWVRIEGLMERSFIGTLLNEPNQDFGYHKGDRISFFVQQLEDNKIVAVSNMNPSAKLTKENLEDGSMLKEAIAAFNNERTQDHLLEVLELLRDSDVWVPCNAVLGKEDEEYLAKLSEEYEGREDELIGTIHTNKNNIRMIPDILQSEDEFFFPVFSSIEEMGEYGKHFSQVSMPLIRTIVLARNNEKDIKGIVINAFTDPFVLNKDIFDVVENMKSRIANDYEKQEASKSVQSFISNISFPETIDELKVFIYEHGYFNVEDILNCEDGKEYWTVPKWAKKGDIIFFMHSKTAVSKITALRTELRKNKEKYESGEFMNMMQWLDRGMELYRRYGGKIFAIGRVSGKPEFEDYQGNDAVPFHWGSKIYADIDSTYVLENPVDISEFNDFILVTRGGAITGVFGEQFEKLREVIARKNYLPKYVRESESIPVPLKDINKDNWIEIARDYRRSFFLEVQFRAFYVDYLLAVLGDRKKVYRECRCTKSTNPDSFADNVILFNGKYLPVEVKLDIKAEKDIKGQAVKYTNVDRCYLKPNSVEYITKADMHSNYVIIIDTFAIYLYEASTNVIIKLYDLDDLKELKDITDIRTKIDSVI